MASCWSASAPSAPPSLPASWPSARARQAHRLAHPDGHDPPGQAHRRPLAEDQRRRAARRRSTTSCSAAGTSSTTTATRRRRRPACSSRRCSSRSARSSRPSSRWPAVFDQRYVKRLDGPERQEGQEQEGPRRAGDRRHPQVQGRAQLLDRLVMVWCGSTEVFMTEVAGAPVAGGVRAGARGQRRRRFRRAWSTPTRRSRKASRTRTRAPNLTRRHPGDGGAGGADEVADCRQGPEDRADADQDDHRARPEGAPARRRGLVLDQHPRQPRRRGAGRSRVVQDQGREQEVGARLHLPAAPLSRSLQGDLATSSASTTTRRAATTRKAGTTSIIVGWLGYPMQLKINFLCRDSILAAPIVLDVGAVPRPGQARGHVAASRSGCRSTSRARMHAPGLYPEHDLFIQLMKLKNTLRYMQGRRAHHAPRARVLRLSEVTNGTNDE